MKTTRKNAVFFCMLMCMQSVLAQTDQTHLITNPSFESDFDGWVHKNMSCQGNNVFSIKDGAVYAEKWTGRGGAVGDGLVSQTIKDLPPGSMGRTVLHWESMT